MYFYVLLCTNPFKILQSVLKLMLLRISFTNVSFLCATKLRCFPKPLKNTSVTYSEALADVLRHYKSLVQLPAAGNTQFCTSNKYVMQNPSALIHSHIITLPDEAEEWWFLTVSMGDVTPPT